MAGVVGPAFVLPCPVRGWAGSVVFGLCAFPAPRRACVRGAVRAPVGPLAGAVLGAWCLVLGVQCWAGVRGLVGFHWCGWRLGW